MAEAAPSVISKEQRSSAGPRRGDGRPPGADLLALGAVLALLSAVAYAFGGNAGASAPDDMEPPLTVLAVDVSQSMVRPRPGISRWLLRKVESEAQAARANGHEIALVTYADGAVRCFGPGPADGFFEALREGGAGWFRSPLPPPQWEMAGGPGGGPGAGPIAVSNAGDAEEPGTDLCGALLVALNLHRSGLRPSGRTVLIGDGTFTGEDPEVLLAEPRLGELKWIEPEPGSQPDLAVLRIRAPSAVEPGAAIRCLVDLHLAHGQTLPDSTHVRFDWTLSETSVAALERGRNRPKMSTGQAITPIPQEALRAARHGGADRGIGGSFSLPVTLSPMKEGSGELLLTATLMRGAAGEGAARTGSTPMVDAFPESNYGAAEWTVGDPTRVLVVAPSDTEGAERIAALFVGPAFDGIEFVTGTAADLKDTMQGSRAPHIVFSAGLPLATLPGPALEAFVLSGGGWFHSEGWSSLRNDGGGLASLRALEPNMEPREPRNILFLVDGSGSMKGPRWQRAKYALAQLLPSISPEDRLELRFFTLVLGSAQIQFEAAPLTTSGGERAERRRAVLARLRDLDIPGGPTDIIGSVSMLMREREEAVAGGDDRSSLVIVISDGRSTISGTAPKPIRSTLMEFGDEIVAIQVGGDGAFRGPLSELAGGVENIVPAGELRGVLGILQEAVQGAKPLENARMHAAPQAGPAFAEMIAEAVRQAQLDSALVIQRALPCRAAEGATLVFEIQTDGPGAGPALEDLRRGAFAAVAARGQGTTAGVALPILDPDGERWAPELERRPQWMGPVFREMRQRFERAQSGLSSARSTPSAAIEIAPKGGVRIVVRGLPPTAPAELRGVLRHVEPSGSSAVASLLLRPPTFGSRGASTRASLRPLVMDRYPRGDAFELELTGTLTGDQGTLTLALRGDGSRESDPTLQPATLLRYLRGTSPASMTGSAPMSAPVPAIGPERQPGSGGPGHPLAPWLAAAAFLALFFGALGHQVPWRSAPDLG